VAWFLFSSGRRFPVVEGVAISIGRDADNDISVPDTRVSRGHALVEVDPTGQWKWIDRSANGTFVEGVRVGEMLGTSTTRFRLGSPSGPEIVISGDPSLPASLPDSGEPVTEAESVRDLQDLPAVSLESTTRIGRASDNDLVLSGPLVSAHHAHVIETNSGFEIIDLASSRGTYVNGRRISRILLHESDVISIGGNDLRFSEGKSLIPVRNESGTPIEASGLTYAVDGQVLLSGLTFTLPARKVLAIVGPSGSGKSTALSVLSGIKTPTDGSVAVGGRDLKSEYQQLRFSIGMVPQQDLVPSQLKVRDALDLAARLRFSRDVAAEDRAMRVEEVIQDLGLAERANLRIDRLSGGQRKRVSVALEMLTKPPVLFLDEPTSGLDPGLDRQVMVLLRELADSGRTVIVVTHAVENLALADYVLVLAEGGHAAYFGPPSEALDYFGVGDYSSVFTTLETNPGHEWARRWKQSSTKAESDSKLKVATDPERVTGSSDSRSSRVGVVEAISQFGTLIRRNTKVIAGDRSYFVLLAVLPLILGVTGFLVGSSQGFGLGPDGSPNPGARFILTIFVLGAVFTGASTSIQELVKDRVIYRRERAVGLSRNAYFLAKVVVFGAIAGVQGFVFSAVALLGRPGPIDPPIFPGVTSVVITVMIASWASCMLGLMLSALLPSRDAALPTLVIITMIQVVLSGAIPIRFEGLTDIIGPVLPGYWAFEAMASSVDLSLLLGSPGDGVWPPTAGHVLVSWAILGLMGAAMILAGSVLAGRHDPGKK